MVTVSTYVWAKQTTSDGCSILEKAVIEHNMTATARIYDTICFRELAAILSMDVRRAEKVSHNLHVINCTIIDPRCVFR